MLSQPPAVMQILAMGRSACCKMLMLGGRCSAGTGIPLSGAQLAVSHSADFDDGRASRSGGLPLRHLPWRETVTPPAFGAAPSWRRRSHTSMPLFPARQRRPYSLSFMQQQHGKVILEGCRNRDLAATVRHNLSSLDVPRRAFQRLLQPCSFGTFVFCSPAIVSLHAHKVDNHFCGRFPMPWILFPASPGTACGLFGCVFRTCMYSRLDSSEVVGSAASSHSSKHVAVL